MSAASDAIRNLITPLLGPGWRVQFGRWVELGGDGADRFAVVRPVGGGPAELVRRPQFTIALIGIRDEGTKPCEDAADAIIEQMRTDSGSIVFMQPGEPVFMPTSDGRPVIEIAVSTIVT